MAYKVQIRNTFFKINIIGFIKNNIIYMYLFTFY